MDSAPIALAEADFPLDAGAIGALIRTHDWAATPLGPIAGWSPTVRAIVQMILLSPVPMVALFGEDATMVYNQGYAAICGPRHPASLGGRLLDVWPEARDFNAEMLARVGAGERLSFRDQQLELWRHGRAERVWMDLEYAPILDGEGTRTGVLAMVFDTTDRVLSERRIAQSDRLYRFLDRLGRETATARDADEVLAITTRMVADHLGLSNCAYADMDPDEDGMNIRGDWHAPGSPSIVGRYRLADFGTLAVQELGAGRPLVINDNLAEIAPEEARTFQDIGIAATICMPLIKEGRLLALMAIHHAVPHHWTEEELVTIREVTERSWAHIQRVGAEAEVRRINASLEQRVEERTGELLAAQEALRQSQKMEAVGQLTGGLAHDFNNLLTGIGGALELMQIRIAQDRAREIGRYIDAAQSAVRRAAALTHRLLAFSRRQTLDPRPTDVNILVAGMEDLIRRTVGPEIAVTVRPAPAAQPVLIDANQLENALLNLCINARDAMPGGGALTIETREEPLSEDHAREHDLVPGHYVMLSVQDTGTGMAPDVIAKAFDPFFTTKPLGEGTGLGLSMTYGFVRQSRGDIWIHSTPGNGTLVCLLLPRHAAALPAAADGVAQSREVHARGDGEVVLVIDDEASVRTLVGEVLGEAGYAVIEAADGVTGLEILRSNTRVDLLVTDVGLPNGLNGRQVADAARVERPSLPVLFITGYVQDASFGQGELAPGMAVITKPFDMATLTAKTREMLKG